jgi:hypothetical protein
MAAARRFAAASLFAVLALAGRASADEAYSVFNPVPADKLGPMCTDRPTKSTGTCTVDAGHWQVETDALDMTWLRQNGVIAESWVVASPTIKLGLTERSDIELALTPYEVMRTYGPAAGPAQAVSGFGDLFLHVKYAVVTGNVAVTLDPFVKAPTARSGLGNGAWEGGLVIPIQANLPKGWQLGVDPELDVLRNAESAGYHYAASTPVTFSHPLSEGLTGSLELWTSTNFDPSRTVRQWSFDLALAQMFGKNLQLDGGVNLGLNRETPQVQAYIGISKRW